MSMRVGESDTIGKSGRKSKRSKKVEMDGVEEIIDPMDVQVDGIGKSGKKSKKKEMDGVEEMNDRTVVQDVELQRNLESRVEKKKKGIDLVAVGKSVNGESFGKFDTDNQPKKVKNKKKKDKRLSVSGEVVTDCLDVVTTDEASSSSLIKREKKLKNVKEHEVPVDTSVNDTQDEGNTVEKWKKKKKKKKTERRKSETHEIQDALNEHTETKAKESNNVVRNVEKKKRKRKMTVKEDDNDKEKKNSARGEDVEKSLVDDDGMVSIAKIKMKKKKKRKTEEITDKDGHSCKAKGNEALNVSKKTEKTKSVDNDPKNPTSKEKKKVRFSKHVEVFPLSDTTSSGNEENEKGRLVQGKRFTPEEDEILRAAVENYIESHCLGEKGLEMVMNCKSYRQVRNCWKEIGDALPHRPRTAIYYRAHILFEGGERLEWTEEKREMLLEQYKKHGNNWKLLAKEFKTHRFHVKDTWRRIKMKRNRGHWSQEEYQSLFDHVNVDLRTKLNEEKNSKHGMLRDNICWSAISDRLSTRANGTCCKKWYNQLRSSMVAEGIWADSDDYRLLDALFNLDACCIEDVDWDDLIDQRSGYVCRKRWDQMVLHIGLHGVKSFAEQVEALAKRYCPELLEVREAWDSKPLVP